MNARIIDHPQRNRTCIGCRYPLCPIASLASGLSNLLDWHRAYKGTMAALQAIQAMSS